MTEQTIEAGPDDGSAPQGAIDPLETQDELSPSAPTRSPRKAEDTSEGCHAMAASDRERASEDVNDRMKAVLERSANAWASRGDMFKRLEAQRDQNNG